MPTTREEGVACCYALQAKFWVTDPDHTMWEVYTFHEDIDHAGEGSVPEANAFAKDVAREKVSWELRDCGSARVMRQLTGSRMRTQPDHRHMIVHPYQHREGGAAVALS